MVVLSKEVVGGLAEVLHVCVHREIASEKNKIKDIKIKEEMKRKTVAKRELRLRTFQDGGTG